MATANLIGRPDELPGLRLAAIVYEFIACRLANREAGGFFASSLHPTPACGFAPGGSQSVPSGSRVVSVMFSLTGLTYREPATRRFTPVRRRQDEEKEEERVKAF